MNVILLLDKSPAWRYDAAGVPLIQRHIDAVAGSRAVRRLAVSADPSWVEDQQFYRVSPFTMPSSKLRSWLRYSPAPPEEQVYEIMKEMAWDEALVFGSFTPFVFSFMIDEIFSGMPNKEYELSQTTWKDAVRGGFLSRFKEKASKFHVTPDNVFYAYSEVIKGAAWEEVMEEINAEQG